MKKNILFVGVTLAMLILAGCKKDEEETTDPITETPTYGEMELEMEHVFNDASFALGTSYTNSSGESVTFNTVKYYVSNVKLTKTDGTVWSQPESYYLVDLSASGSNMLHIHDIPTGDYTSVTFTLGVDSTRNVSGAQTGALSISNGMFWSWNSGYIFAKFEGDSDANVDGFSYHLGGFSGANAALNTATYSFAPALLNIRQDAAPVVHMGVNLANVFGGSAGPLSVANTSVLHMPGAMANMIADNFHSGVELEHIHN